MSRKVIVVLKVLRLRKVNSWQSKYSRSICRVLLVFYNQTHQDKNLHVIYLTIHLCQQGILN